jgi:D-alanyl-D-alanine carboxypeptidase
MSNKEKFITIGLSSFAIVMSFLMLPNNTNHIDARQNNTAAAIVSAASPDYFSEVTIDAHAAYVYDISTQQALYAKNETTSLPLASITKIMTAITALEMVPKDTIVTIHEQDLAEVGDHGLYVDEQWDLTTLLKFMLVASSNDAASAVATSISPDMATFIAQMNAQTQSLGFSTMRFKNPSGLDESQTEAGAYGSAQDVAHMLAYALKRDAEVIEPTRYPSINVTSLNGFEHYAANTDIISEEIPSLIAGKTGYTELAGGNLVVIFDVGIQHPIAVVVLGSTYDGRFEDVKKLIDATIKTVVNQ